ncbi:MAG: hypothetical protein EOP48_18370 [Sphingobacteriales bacterium]|nr:MAG: hypothetical protein EOP48_18370 [Sphingobacteriales bacterium]
MSVEVIILDQYVTSGVACECCGYIVTIEKRMFDICLVCQWEFTNTSEDEYSGPNHTTLASYRNRYESRRANNKFDLIYVKFRSSNKSLKNDEVI